jgi:hypothetical protein
MSELYLNIKLKICIEDGLIASQFTLTGGLSKWFRPPLVKDASFRVHPITRLKCKQ